jgi:hypothetical protein
MRPRFIVVMAASAVFAGGSFAAASGAQALTAATAHGGAAVSAAPLPPSGTIKARSSRSQANVIVCDAVEALAISNPHHSHHQPKNVNVIATVTCSKTVSAITLAVRLDRNGKRVNAKTFTKLDKSFLKGNASSGCKGTAGTYQGFADVRVTFPPGFDPPVESAHLASKAVKVDCFS